MGSIYTYENKTKHIYIQVSRNKGEFIGLKHIRLERIDSTNVYAIDLLSKGKPQEGTVISAAYQTAGKGQYGRVWESKANQNILLSVILYPSFLEAKSQFKLNQALVIGIRNWLKHLGLEQVRIKWPNDIYVMDKKLGGILIQNSIYGKFIQNTVFGLGLNVNQLDFKGAPNPISLKNILGSNLDLNPLMESLFRHLEQGYLYLESRNFNILNDQYHEALYKYNEQAIFKKADGSELVGLIVGVNAEGKLKIKSKIGIAEYSMDEIKMII